MDAALPEAAKKTLFEDAIRSHEKLQPQIQQSRVTQETVARMTGATSVDMEFDLFCELVVNQAKEIDNADAKKKVCKALKMKLNQHQQGRGKGGKGSGSHQCPAWRDDLDLADCVHESIPAEKWKAMSLDDKKKHTKKEEKRQEEHKKKKETKRARQRVPRQANNHNLVDRGANSVIACEIIPDEAETTAVESPTEIPSDDTGGQVAHLLSTTHAKKAKSQKALVHGGLVHCLGKHIQC